MTFFLFLVSTLSFMIHAAEQPSENPATIIESAQIAADDDDAQPYVNPGVFTLSPTTQLSPREQEKLALREQFRQNLPEQHEAIERYKEMKKNWGNKASSGVTLRPMNEMTLLELIQRKNELILQGDYKLALKYLEQILKVTENAEQVIFVMLETAELLMKIEQYAKAEKLFTEFIQLYPGNEFVEQAFVKAIQCSWKQTSSFDRDQTKTEETLALITRFETRQAICSPENITIVAEVKHLCEHKLADANMYVAKHYIGRGIFRSAHKRLDGIRQKDVCKIPEIEPQLLGLEIELAQAEKNKVVEEAKVAELFTKFPQHEISLALLPKIQFPGTAPAVVVAQGPATEPAPLAPPAQLAS